MTTTTEPGQGCPEGMYPMDAGHRPEQFTTFAALRCAAEKASDSLNFPISWHLYDNQHEDWGQFLDDGQVADRPEFTLTFLMPRKGGQTWGMTTRSFDRDEVLPWLDTWLRGEVARWFGWT